MLLFLCLVLKYTNVQGFGCNLNLRQKKTCFVANGRWATVQWITTYPKTYRAQKLNIINSMRIRGQKLLGKEGLYMWAEMEDWENMIKNTLYKILKELKELENLQVNRVKRYIKFMLHSDLGMVA